MVGTNGEHLRRVGVGFEVNDGEGVTERVKNRGLVHLMVVRRWMNLHTLEYRNTICASCEVCRRSVAPAPCLLLTTSLPSVFPSACATAEA